MQECSPVCVPYTAWEGFQLCLPIWNTIILLEMRITRINEISKQGKEIKYEESK